jgi:uncharacterized metal-binding protein
MVSQYSFRAAGGSSLVFCPVVGRSNRSANNIAALAAAGNTGLTQAAGAFENSRLLGQIARSANPVFATELIDAPAGIDDFLLTSIERMAG